MNALSRMADRPSRMALGWFVAAAAVFAVAALVAAVLATAVGVPGPRALPAAFVASTLLLTAVGGGLATADVAAKREKQPWVRRGLAAALAAATLFLAVQTNALTGLLAEADPETAPTGAAVFLFTLAATHGLHAAAATMWLAYVTLRGFAGRYDHEYRLGLSACGWFWHSLGAAWLAILAAVAVAG